MKKFILFSIFALCGLLGSDSSSHKTTSADSSEGRGTFPPYSSFKRKSREVSSTSTTYTAPERPQRNIFNSSISIETEGDPIVINVQLESMVYIQGKRVEFVLRLWDLDRPIATKKVKVEW